MIVAETTHLLAWTQRQAQYTLPQCLTERRRGPIFWKSSQLMALNQLDLENMGSQTLVRISVASIINLDLSLKTEAWKYQIKCSFPFFKSTCEKVSFDFEFCFLLFVQHLCQSDFMR